jgi:hypothetical protein
MNKVKITFKPSPFSQRILTKSIMANKWPWWLLFWLTVSSFVVLWDVGFILARPHSMEGGKYSHIWAPYPNYYNVDLAYADLNNPWIVAQTYGNIVESALNLFSVLLYFQGSVRLASVVAMNSTMMTFWKTVLYWVVEYCANFVNVGHNTTFDMIFVFIIPNGFWLVVPLACVFWFANYFMHLSTEPAPRATKSKAK